MDVKAPPHAIVGVSGSWTDASGATLSSERIVRIEMPDVLTRDHVALMRNDLLLLTELAERYPEDMLDVHRAVLGHDFSRATEIANRIGLTEEAMVSRGGGQVGLALGIAAGLAVYALLMSSSSGGGDTTATPAEPTVGLDGGAPPGGAP